MQTFVCSLFAQDTLVDKQLKGICVDAQAKLSETKSQTPMQIIDKQRIEQINAIQLSDAVKQFSGVVMKDYGGIGGIKTISARGLGSQFSTLTIDGIAIGDCQNGQPDLGRFFVTDIDNLTFANGQFDDIFQAARVLSSSNVLNLKTAKPNFQNRNTHLKVGFEVGSFGLFHPYVNIEQKITKKLSISLQGSYIQSDGDYPFTIYYTNLKQDSSSRQRRQHSAIKMGTIVANAFYSINNKQDLTLKAHYYNAFQELPGPIIYYKETNGSENSWDKFGFIQLHYINRISNKLKFQTNGKIYQTKNIYEDTAYKNSAGFLRNNFKQSEYYVTASILYEPIKFFKVSYSTDYFYNTLISNIENYNHVNRHSYLNAISANVSFNKVNISASALYCLYSENINHNFEKDYKHFSPYFGILYKPFSNIDLRFRYFIKKNYRLPNFNECYYSALSRNLKPEKAFQNNLGITFERKNLFSFIQDVTISLDGYYNRVSNKIIAIPRQSLYLWSMQNIGLVSIAGLDAKIETNFLLPKQIKICLSANYSYQKALDITETNSKTYKQQIPYTPKHSATTFFYFSSSIVDFGYNLIFVGNRYKLAQNTENNLVKGYVDQSIILSKKIDLKWGKLTLQGQILNLFNIQYEIVNSYPMMGRNYKLKIMYEL